VAFNRAQGRIEYPNKRSPIPALAQHSNSNGFSESNMTSGSSDDR